MVSEEYIPQEQQSQEDQPYIPVDDRTDRQILLEVETSITQVNQRMDGYEQNQAELLKLIQNRYGEGSSTS